MSHRPGQRVCPRCGGAKGVLAQVCTSCNRELGVWRRILSRSYGAEARCYVCRRPIVFAGRCWQCAAGPGATRTVAPWYERGR